MPPMTTSEEKKMIDRLLELESKKIIKEMAGGKEIRIPLHYDKRVGK